MKWQEHLHGVKHLAAPSKVEPALTSLQAILFLRSLYMCTQNDMLFVCDFSVTVKKKKKKLLLGMLGMVTES